ncbi:MAG: hypothetical protein AAGH99_08625 [Planctomycetota bacterium]
MIYSETPRRLVVVIGCVLAWSLAVHGSEAENTPGENDLSQLIEENQRLREQVVTLTAELEALRQELARLREHNAELTEETTTLEQEATTLQALAEATDDDRVFREQAQRIKQAYNPQNDRTIATFGLEELDAQGSAGTFYFAIAYHYSGQPIALPPILEGSAPRTDKATLTIQTYRAGRLFQNKDKVRFIADGEPIMLRVVGYDITPRRAGQPGRTRIDRSDESVELEVDRLTLATLGGALELKIEAGRAELAFDRDDLAAVRAVARRMAGE